jgi:hypothetical protein
MKKLLLSCAFLGAFISAEAQLYPSGTGPYTQDFNTLTSTAGLPVGWKVYSGSSASSIGTAGNYSNAVIDGVYNDTTCGNITGGFKNYPSATAVTAGTSCTAQQAISDRALGVRQVSPQNSTNPNLDSGAAFVLNLANTAGMSSLTYAFDLQSLDTSSPRVTTWKLQYRIGTTGNFNDVATSPSTLTTGGHVFSNTNVTATFPAALDNQGSPVYIRIVTLDFSSGTGNRPSTAIDNVSLGWTGTAKTGINDLAANTTLPLSVVSATTSAIALNFDAADAGNYTVVLTDMAGRTVATKSVVVARGNQTVTVDGIAVAPGVYVAKITNGAATGITKVSVQ